MYLARFLRIFLVSGLLLPLPLKASELFWSHSLVGDINRFDTETMENTFILSGNDVPNNVSTGPNGGLAFRTRGELLVTSDGRMTGSPAIARFRYDGSSLSLISQRAASSTVLNLQGAVRGPGNRIFTAGNYSNNLVSFGADAWEKDSEGVWHNRGPAPTVEAAAGSYAKMIAYSPLDGRIAVGYNQGVAIFRTDLGGTTWERTIPIAGFHNTAGLAFDYDGLPVLDAEGKEIGRKSLLYIADKNTNDIRRFDASTGDPYGADEADRGNPVFIAAGTAGMSEIGTFAIDPADGNFYVENLNTSQSDSWGGSQWVLSRFSRTGSPLNSAVMVIGFHNIRFMTFRPRLQELTVSGGGLHIIGPGGYALKIDADLWLKAAMEAQQQLVNYLGTDPIGEVRIGGDGSGGVVLRVTNGGVMKTVKFRIGAQGELNVAQNTTVEASDGIAAGPGSAIAARDGGILRAGPVMEPEHGLVSVVADTSEVVADNGGEIIATGGGNIISTGGGNIIATGGGNIISTGGGNIIATGGGNIISTGGGNLIANISSLMDSGVGPQTTLTSVAAPLQFDTGALVVEPGGSLRTGDPVGEFVTEGGSVDIQPGGSVWIDIGGAAPGRTLIFTTSGIPLTEASASMAALKSVSSTGLRVESRRRMFSRWCKPPRRSSARPRT